MIKYLVTRQGKDLAKRILLLHIFFFSIVFEIEGQNVNRVPLGFSDVYVLKAKFDESLLQKKTCCIYKGKTKCNLYKIEVTSVLYCPVNTVFDSTSLMKVEYIIAPISFADSLRPGVEFLITAMPSTSKNYIAFTRKLDVEMLHGAQAGFYHQNAYLSSLIKCKKKRKNSFDDFILAH